MGGFDGVKTTAAVKYRQFEPNWAHYPRHPDTKRGEEGAESGIFPRLSPILDGSCSPHSELTWATISSHSRALGSLNVAATSLSSPGCATDIMPWHTSTAPSSSTYGNVRAWGVMTVYERMLVDRLSPHPATGD